jgi:hypothetical protein
MGAKELARFMDPDGNIYISILLPSGQVTTFVKNGRTRSQAKLDKEIALEALRGF